MSSRLKAKVCVITGKGGSMGRASALAFAREGALVVGCDLSVDVAEATVELVRGSGGDMVSKHPCDLSHRADCQALGDLALGSFGRVDVLINLGAKAYFNRLEDISDEERDRSRGDEVDLVFYLTRAAWPHLKASRGVVVNVASVDATLVAKVIPSLSHTTNEAEIGMTRQLAMEGSEHGIRVNSISPGLIEAGATRDQLEDPQWASYVVGRTLLGGHGRPKEVANVALFLASDATSCMTGADGLVDSGMKVG
jgi:NAD(P)-dependent dehydrogenase (short-subunit alcohol dehydrogenase family)